MIFHHRRFGWTNGASNQRLAYYLVSLGKLPPSCDKQKTTTRRLWFPVYDLASKPRRIYGCKIGNKFFLN